MRVIADKNHTVGMKQGCKFIEVCYIFAVKVTSAFPTFGDP